MRGHKGILRQDQGRGPQGGVCTGLSQPKAGLEPATFFRRTPARACPPEPPCPQAPGSPAPSSSQAWQRAQRVLWWFSQARKVPRGHGRQVEMPQGFVQGAFK